MRTIPFLFLLTPHLFGQSDPPAGWAATSPMIEARASSCAVHLTDGRILVTGGKGISGDLNTTEFYMADGSFVAGPRMNASRSSHTCTLLHDGRVLVAGGDTDGAGSAEIFDPVTGAWEFLAGTGEARRGHTATLMPEGQVLLTGGDGGSGPLDSIEIFDPQSDSLISSDPALLAARSQHATVALPDGRVMLIGGQGASGPLASTEIFDPRDFSIAAGPTLTTPRAGHSAVRMDDGRILVAGGFDGNQETNTAEILQPGANAWAKLDAQLNTARRDHLSILIPGNGGVLIAGGLQAGKPLGATEVFLPVENTFLLLGPLTLARSGIAVAAVDAGLILAAGGNTADGPQKACGVLQVPAIKFDKLLYHIPETASATFSSFPVSAKVNLSLSVAPGTGTFDANSRLLTSSVTVPANSSQTVPIVLTVFQDAGKTVRVTASAAGASIVATAQVRNATALSLALPVAVYEGANQSILALLSRGAATGTMTGTLSMNTSTLADGTSNTIVFGETPGAATTVVNTTGSAATIQKSLTHLAPGSLLVSAAYSGDVGNDAASASGIFSVVSRTPSVQLTTSTITAQAGVPFTVSATAQTNGTVPNPQPLTGQLTLSQSGFPVIGATGFITGGALATTASITPLTLLPITLNAAYSGDSFFRPSSAPPITLTVAKGPTTLTINNPPATYSCGDLTNFSVTLSYPIALGLSNLNVLIQPKNSNGSLGFASVNSLNVIPPGPKDTVAKATSTVAVILPLDITGVAAIFGNDPFLKDAVSADVRPTLQLGSTSVLLTNPTTLVNPAFLNAEVSASHCSVKPTGTVEFLDGSNSLGVVSLPAGSVSPTNVTSFGGAAVASLQVSRPPGVHNISVRYSGDNHYLPSTSSPVAVTFQ